MMGSEVLLYGYGLVCLSMLGFNILYSLHLRVSDRRLKRRMGDIARLVAAQLAVVQAGKKVERRHLKEMGRRLSRVNNLLAFDHFLDEQDDEAPAFRSYLRQIQPVFLYLTTVYRRREDMQAGYFCHFLARHQLQRHMQMQQMQPLVASYLEKGSLYCKINALKALCAFGSAETIVQALLQLDKQADGTLHEKVLTETLMAFTGKADMLIGLLWSSLGNFLFRCSGQFWITYALRAAITVSKCLRFCRIRNRIGNCALRQFGILDGIHFNRPGRFCWILCVIWIRFTGSSRPSAPRRWPAIPGRM